jgi:hypothetical protein
MNCLVSCWHEPDQMGCSDDVCCSGKTGSGWQSVKMELLTHMRRSTRASPLSVYARSRYDVPAS